MTTLTLKRGDTWRVEYLWTDDQGDPIDLTGCSARLQLRDKRTDALVLSASTGTGELTIQGAEGKVVQVVPATTTATIVPKDYLTDLELTFLDGTVMSTDTSTVRVEKDITHD